MVAFHVMMSVSSTGAALSGKPGLEDEEREDWNT